MAHASCLGAGDFELGRDQVPGGGFTQTFAGAARGSMIVWRTERLCCELESLSQHCEQMAQTLQRGRFHATLDATDRVLARTGS